MHHSWCDSNLSVRYLAIKSMTFDFVNYNLVSCACCTLSVTLFRPSISDGSVATDPHLRVLLSTPPLRHQHLRSTTLPPFWNRENASQWWRHRIFLRCRHSDPGLNGPPKATATRDPLESRIEGVDKDETLFYCRLSFTDALEWCRIEDGCAFGR